MPKNLDLTAEGYDEFLRSLKGQIQHAQIKASLAVNRELVLLYWQIGREILIRQDEKGWGAKVIQQLSKDLQKEFPNMKGFSRTNLLYMRSFAAAYADEQFVQQLAGQIPWFHNCVLLDKVKNAEERIWYIQQTIKNGWSRNVLSVQIETDLYRRQGGAITNFEQTLPLPQSDLAQQIVKDPYCFDFLTISSQAREHELENALLNHIREFLVELGLGFAFLGSQYPIEIDGKEYRLDLLFYHIHLRCFVVIDLKMTEFIPEYSGKMNFYVAAIDDLLKHPTDNPTIGLILCKSKSKTTVEYALRTIKAPIGVSTHRIPDSLKEKLPSPEQLEMELNAAIAEVENEQNELAGADE